jgi:hypothetical protein
MEVAENVQFFEFLDRSVVAFDNLFQSYNHRIVNKVIDLKRGRKWDPGNTRF